MRTIQTFVLRLIVNSDEPEALRGVIRSVATGEERLFAGNQEFLLLLHEILHRPAAPDCLEDSDNSMEGKHEHQSNPATHTS